MPLRRETSVYRHPTNRFSQTIPTPPESSVGWPSLDGFKKVRGIGTNWLCAGGRGGGSGSGSARAMPAPPARIMTVVVLASSPRAHARSVITALFVVCRNRLVIPRLLPGDTSDGLANESSAGNICHYADERDPSTQRTMPLSHISYERTTTTVGRPANVAARIGRPVRWRA